MNIFTNLGCLARIISYSEKYTFVYVNVFKGGFFTIDWTIDWHDDDIMLLRDDVQNCMCITEQMICEKLEFDEDLHNKIENRR